ncbi:MAG: hypothetical protein U5Q44_01415 [Dehalococcoidia bacterium]|nr:hypothetical protein [Dehalococcoidia bacterium]
MLVREPGLVGGVLEQAADQVGHPRDELASGDVDADQVAKLGDGLAEPFGHSVEHLEFNVLARKAGDLGADHGLGDASRVVRGKGWLQVGVGIEQQTGAVLEVAVGLSLVFEDGDVVALLVGEDGLFVPVGALDQSDGNGRATLGGERFESCDIGRGITQVGLHDDADAVPATELVVAEDFGEGVVDEVLVAVLLHVDVDEDAELAGAPEDGNQPRGDIRGSSGRRGRFEVGGERRQLDRYVGARRTVGCALDLQVSEAFNQVQVAVAIGVGFVVREGGFAEEVDGVGGAIVDELAEPGQGFSGRGAGDEAGGHGLDALADCAAERGAKEGPAGRPGADASERRASIAEVLAHVVGDGR